MGGKWTVATVVVGLLFATEGSADLVRDDFDDGVLDSAWSISLGNITGWAYEEANSVLTVRDVQPVQDAGWVRAALTQAVPPTGDFAVDMTLAWESLSSDGCMMRVGAWLMDGAGGHVASIRYSDTWNDRNGVRVAMVGDGEPLWDRDDSFGHTGSAWLRIQRTDDILAFYWDGAPFETGINSTPVEAVQIHFDTYSGVLQGFFGVAHVDHIALTPEPGSLVLLAIGGLAVLRRKRTWTDGETTA